MFILFSIRPLLALTCRCLLPAWDGRFINNLRHRDCQMKLDHILILLDQVRTDTVNCPSVVAPTPSDAAQYPVGAQPSPWLVECLQTQPASLPE